MTTDGEMRHALTRLGQTGSEALNDEEFKKLVEIVRGDARLGKIEIPEQAKFVEWCKKAHGIEVQPWTMDGGYKAMDFLLPRVTREGRLLIRLLDLDRASLITGMYTTMEDARQHRLITLQVPGVWHAPGQAPPVTAQGDAPGPIASSDELPDLPGLPSALAGSQEATFPEGYPDEYAVPHTLSPLQRRRLLDGTWAHAAIMHNAPLRDPSSTLPEAVRDGIAALQSTDYVGTEEAQAEVNRWLEDLQGWWSVRQASNP